MPGTESSKAAVIRSLGEELSPSSLLCTRCGLCCMGALHNAAVLDPDEIPSARALELPVLDDEKPTFALPCPRLNGTVCTIYSEKPRVCGRYKCQLLQDLEGGHKQLDDALELVASAKALLDRARQAAPLEMSLRKMRDLAQGIEESQPSLRRQDLMELKLRATALELFLDRYFRNERDRRSLVLGSPIGEVSANGIRTVRICDLALYRRRRRPKCRPLRPNRLRYDEELASTKEGAFHQRASSS